MSPTPRIRFLITSSDGLTEITELAWSSAVDDAITLRCLNQELAVDATSVYINVTRGDLRRTDNTWETTQQSNSMGRELIDEMWLEGKFGAGAWTPLDEYANYLDLGAIDAADYAEFQLRLNVPASITSIGDVHFALVIRARG